MKKAKPDLFADPEGYEHIAFVNRSFDKLKRRNAKEFDAAYAALVGLNPNNRLHCGIVRKIYNADNPAQSLLQWWRGPTKTKGKAK